MQVVNAATTVKVRFKSRTLFIYEEKAIILLSTLDITPQGVMKF
ncbi:MAG TPA: hypothetical protein VKA40_04395 [Nitrososphaera sp.]|nr:hypothetical protein [Nitrososphaera sp.]HKI07600.1 hypothetical protein [Nitrososphaeraceae archaeon]